MSVVFQNLSYTTSQRDAPKSTKTILKSVTGYILPGTITGVMGRSGGGKTTLLDVLTGRKSQGSISGSIMYNGRSLPSQSFLRNHTGYIEQTDVLIPSLTVTEMLLYTAELLMPWQTPAADKLQKVEHVISKMGLKRCRDTVIGSQLLRGISGGEAKRVNIGLALLRSPHVLFLDEPTSGLDSSTGDEVLAVVRELAVSGNVAVCCTLHQPSPYAMSTLDQLLVLSGGHTVFWGRPAEMPGYVAALLPPAAAPSIDPDTALRVLLGEATAAAPDLSSEDARVHAFQSSALCSHCASTAASLLADEAPSKGDAASESSLSTGSTATPCWWAVRTLFKHRSLRNYCTPSHLMARATDKVVVSLLLVLMSVNLGRRDDVAATINIISILFLWCALPAFLTMACTATIIEERALTVRETSDGLYGHVAYLLWRTIEEAGVMVLVALVTSLAVYYAVGLAGSVAMFALINFMALLNSMAVSFLAANLGPNMDAAAGLSVMWTSLLALCCGSLIRVQDIAPWLRWFSSIDYLRYAFEGLMLNQFSSSDPAYLGSTVLSTYNIRGSSLPLCLAAMALSALVYWALAAVAISYIKHHKR